MQRRRSICLRQKQLIYVIEANEPECLRLNLLIIIDLNANRRAPGGSNRKASVRTIRLTARRSFPRVFLTASNCICLFKFNYLSSFSRLIDSQSEEKKTENMCMCGTRRRSLWDTEWYKDIHERIADGCDDRKKRLGWLYKGDNKK